MAHRCKYNLLFQTVLGNTMTTMALRISIAIYTLPMATRVLVKKYGGVGVVRSREEVGHEVLSLVQRVGRAIFSYP